MSLYSPNGWIFIHNRKTGGTTMRSLLVGPLVRYLTIPHDPAIDVRDYMRAIGALGHWNLAFKFAFVRDPYTWVESMRRHALAQGDHPLSWAANNVLEWPEMLCNSCMIKLRTTDGVLCFQRDMVNDDHGSLLVDRVCYFENYAAEVEWLGAHLGIEMPKTLPTIGLNDIYTANIGGEYRERIAHYFSEDFNALGYTP